MGPPLNPAPVALVRALFAHTFAGANAQRGALGTITLLPSQHEAVRRAHAAIAQFGGTLIADDVGTGKTFVALALVENAARPIVFAPAALGGMWAAAAAQAGVMLPFVSIESLGRGRQPPTNHDFVIVDEAHHLRNPATRRYAAVRAAVTGSKVVLLSATPVHNRARDLDALLALIVGAGARDLDDAARARIVVRSTHAGGGPAIVVHDPIAVRDAREITGAIGALPSPLVPLDGGDAPFLQRLSLMRAWCSSVGALAAMLRRATLQAGALGDAFRAGRHPTRAELGAWSTGGDGQLAFAEIAVQAGCDANIDSVALDSHMAALATLRNHAHRHSALDDERAAHLVAISTAHPGIPVLACTQYAATVDALWRRLRLRPGVAALTSRGARIASGPIARTDALERFAPVAQRAAAPHARERIQLLVTTDLVSEGLNLHDAGVVVHLDLPWTAARLAQRVGRVARLGSPHAVVHTYTIAPPHAAATLLALERRVRTKRRIASRLVGGGERISQLLGGAAGGTGAPEAHARILAMLAPHAGPRAAECDAVVCVARAPCDGWLALVSTPAGMRFVIRLRRSPPTTDPRVVVRGIEWLVTCDEHSLATGWHRAAREAERWCATDRARRLSGAGRRHAARALGRSLAATVGTVGCAAPHDRARAAGVASGQMQELAPQARAEGSERLVALVVFCTNAKAPHRPPV